MRLGKQIRLAKIPTVSLSEEQGSSGRKKVLHTSPSEYFLLLF
jgi:hypothetical protein